MSEDTRGQALVAENARLRQQLASARGRYAADIVRLWRERNEAIAEAAVLRHRDRQTQAVVEAAVDWRLAVDFYEKGPTEALASPQSAEQPPVEALATDGATPQGEAQGAAGASWKSPVHTTSGDEADGWKAIQGFVNRLRRDVDRMQATFLGAVPPLTEVLPEPAPVADNDHDPDGEVPEAGRAGEAQERTEGLDAAIEAVAQRFAKGKRDAGLYVVFEASDGHNSIRGVNAVEAATEAVRAASPLIERAALLAAADDWMIDWLDEGTGFPLKTDDWLRDRATRTETS
jgi:hypothetical protein